MSGFLKSTLLFAALFVGAGVVIYLTGCGYGVGEAFPYPVGTCNHSAIFSIAALVMLATGIRMVISLVLFATRETTASAGFGSFATAIIQILVILFLMVVLLR